MQQPQTLTCINCNHTYDLYLGLIRNLPTCDHPICSFCITSLLEKSEPLKCPIDETTYELKGMTINDFKIKEAPQDQELCQVHCQKLRLKCLRDGAKICNECARSGDHKDHEVKIFHVFTYETQKKVELLEKHLQELTDYYDKITEVIDEQEKRMLEVVTSNCEKINAKPEREVLIAENIIANMKEERKALDEILGVGSAFKLAVVKKIVFLKTEVLENVDGKINEEDLDISGYLDKITNAKFEKSLKKIEEALKKRTEVYYLTLELYASESFNVANMNWKPIVKKELSYLTKLPGQRRCPFTAKRGFFRVFFAGLLLFLVLNVLVAVFGRRGHHHHFDNWEGGHWHKHGNWGRWGHWGHHHHHHHKHGHHHHHHGHGHHHGHRHGHGHGCGHPKW